MPKSLEEIIKRRSIDGNGCEIFGRVLDVNPEISEDEYLEICKTFKRAPSGTATGGSTEFDKTRFITFVASDETVDSYGDILRVDGVDLTRFKTKSAAFICSHDIRDIEGACGVIVNARKAKNVEGSPEGKAVLVSIYFPTAEEDEDADYIFKKYKSGTLNAVSVGFTPIACNDPPLNSPERKAMGLGPHGVEFTKWAPYELSAVTVGANPNALMQRTLKNQTTDTIIKMIEDQNLVIAEIVKNITSLVAEKSKESEDKGIKSVAQLRDYFDTNPLDVTIK